MPKIPLSHYRQNVVALVEKGGLNGFESEFMTSMMNRDANYGMSEKQEAVLIRSFEKHGIPFTKWEPEPEIIPMDNGSNASFDDDFEL